MPYRLKAGQSVPDNVRRIVTEQIDLAVQQLRARDTKKRDEAIHEARKSIKKIRGVLKLVRPELGRIYRTENDALRSIGGKLSELRDAGAMIEMLDSLAEKYSGKLRHSSLHSIRQGLERSKREKERALQVSKVMRDAAARLLTLRKRVLQWPLSSDGFDALAWGLKDSYRRARKAMAAAKKKDKPELYHEWRKRTKDHWYYVRLLESLWIDVMEPRERNLHDLETWLGDDHNLIVLQQQLDGATEAFGDDREKTLFKALAQERRNELRENSFISGQRLFEEKPKQFVRRMAELWNIWNSSKESTT
jgi:CHAD domain-containing protein